MSKVTIKVAAELTGKTRETINRATTKGKLSFERDGRGTKVVDVAELGRVYPLIMTMEEFEKVSGSVNKRQASSASDGDTEVAVLRERLASSESMREAITVERERERRQLESEIEVLRTNLDKYQDQHSKALLLISNQPETSSAEKDEWRQSVRELQEKITDQQSAFEERVGELKAEARQEVLDEIKSRPWWRLLRV